ncbi:MAG: integrase core domain-containing protein [Methylococcales bacterium]|nr:integrase core domain-containing protein [Methylococcales bacterium]
MTHELEVQEAKYAERKHNRQHTADVGFPSILLGLWPGIGEALIQALEQFPATGAELTARWTIFLSRLWRTVKYENVYLKKYDGMQDLLLGLTQYFLFYNEDRRHQSLSYETPDEVYQTAMDGGAKIIDKYNDAGTTLELVKQDWDSAIQLECEQGSILNQAIIRLDNGVHFKLKLQII